MKWQNLDRENCSLARAMAVVGDRWTLLVLRETFLRVRRFDEFQENLGIARRVLTERLKHLVDHGVLERVAYSQTPLRYEYRLTEKGLGLYPVIISLVHWGDAYYAGKKGPPLLHRHKTCGHDFHSVLTCSECGEAVSPRDVVPHPGPGARKGAWDGRLTD
ncbi:HxlR family transcriptional regulator [Hyphomonas sp. CACIAM 19H1]|uniref:winged helix-turn-helix transcriptional regulator n=1 Tax=Hyphomonas sp. CACIAM 19H1 TaxID=1873716 RepID=UPI000DEE0A31|nr:helix-turn-helix domain-containing protein [Hyphomonas sp. CACIAM 19H1]AXE64537.1 HxlR family transcriptional regulator [Hyphomonas sp. CACIAM 19H1]